MDNKKLVAARKVLEKDGYDVMNFLGETAEKENGERVLVVSFMYTKPESYVPEYATVKIPMSRIKEFM